MDKLKYIKLENPDGSYSDSIPLSVDASHIDINSSSSFSNLGAYIGGNDINIENLQKQTAINTNNINSTRSIIETLTDGSPKGSYSTVTALVNANPNTGIYIITENGHIYSWTRDGSTATDLGLYQAISLANKSVTAVDLNNETGKIYNFLERHCSSSADIYFSSDGGINDDGTLNNNTNLSCRTITASLPGGTYYSYLGIRIAEGFEYRIVLYNTAGTYTAETLEGMTEWTSLKSDYKISNYSVKKNKWLNCFKIEVRRTDGNPITATMCNNATVLYYYELDEDKDSIININNNKPLTFEDFKLYEWVNNNIHYLGNTGVFVKAGSIIKIKRTSVFYRFHAYILPFIQSPDFDENNIMAKATKGWVQTSDFVNGTKILKVYQDGFFKFRTRKEDDSTFGNLEGLKTEFLNAIDISNAYTIYKENLYNKNLVSTHTSNPGYFIQLSTNTGVVGKGTSSSGWNRSMFFPALPNKCFKLTGPKNVLNEQHAVVFYNDLGQGLSFARAATGEITGITPEDTAYIGLQMKDIDVGNLEFYLYNSSEWEEDDDPVFKNEKNHFRLFWDTPGVKFIAHRGYYVNAPEASPAAYEAAGQAGFWAVKVDVCETKDGHFVISHDATVDRLFNATGNIRDYTLAELKDMTQISAGVGSNIESYPNLKIMTLEEGLAILKKYGMVAHFEMKSLINNSTSIDNLLTILKNYGYYWNCSCQQSSSSTANLYQLREKSKIIPIYWWTGDDDTYFEDRFERCQTLGNAIYALDSMSGATIDETFDHYAPIIRENGFPLVTAMTNNLTRIKRWVNDYGLDAVVTGRVKPSDLYENENN